MSTKAGDSRARSVAAAVLARGDRSGPCTATEAGRRTRAAPALEDAVRISGVCERKGRRHAGPQHTCSKGAKQIVCDRPHLFRRVREVLEVRPLHRRRLGGKAGDIDGRAIDEIGASGSCKIGSNDAASGERRHLRLKGVGGAAEPMNADHRLAIAGISTAISSITRELIPRAPLARRSRAWSPVARVDQIQTNRILLPSQASQTHPGALAVRAMHRSATQRAQHVTAVPRVSSTFLMGQERGRLATSADGHLAARISGYAHAGAVERRVFMRQTTCAHRRSRSCGLAEPAVAGGLGVQDRVFWCPREDSNLHAR